MATAQEHWIESHPYLREVAEFEQKITAAFAGAKAGEIAMPQWAPILEKYVQGIPLLENTDQLIYAQAAGSVLSQALESLVAIGLTESIQPSAQSLLDHLRSGADAPAAAIQWVYNGDPTHPPVDSSGLLRLLAWPAIVRALQPVLNSFAELRKEDDWGHGDCPVCGAPPAMASILANTPRKLVCGYCRTSWQFRRIGCAFCDNVDPKELEIFTSEEEPLFRLDHCKLCNGYLKTYTGRENMDLFLSDWASLHLDLVARQNGLERKAGALLEL
ncbi:MAG: formate dehydrogenase accessory protein FdhE [Acidobacteriota bacterium]|nr:formate dehydrogenase accessory protein FdhE [Acidobacteriota bacterium]